MLAGWLTADAGGLVNTVAEEQPDSKPQRAVPEAVGVLSWSSHLDPGRRPAACTIKFLRSEHRAQGMICQLFASRPTV